MRCDERQERRTRRLLWVLVACNVLGLYLLRHPEVLQARVRPVTNYAVRPAAPLADAA